MYWTAERKHNSDPGILLLFAGGPGQPRRNLAMTTRKLRMRLATIALAATCLMAAACGTMTGAAVGAGTGAAIGAGTGYGAGKGALIGTGVGAAGGAIYDITR